jgi:hypothetical protein
MLFNLQVSMSEAIQAHGAIVTSTRGRWAKSAPRFVRLGGRRMRRLLTWGRAWTPRSSHWRAGIQEILNLPVGAQAHDRDFCAILQALGLDIAGGRRCSARPPASSSARVISRPLSSAPMSPFARGRPFHFAKV